VETLKREGMRNRLRQNSPLGDMRVGGGEAGDAVLAEARAEPVDQSVEIGSLNRFAGEIDLSGILRLGAEHGETHHVEAEAGVPIGGERCEPFGKEQGDCVRRAERRGCADLGTGDLPIDAEESGLQKARAESIPLKYWHERAGQRGDGL
jgi:hypothetical protein